jgi:YegS/Rv2252/BmrU family lipid kinase
MRGLDYAHSEYGEAVVIYNPYAGRLARREHLLQRTIEEFGRQGIRARLVPTTGPNTAAAIAKRAIDGGADLIIAAGGDGTINEVANGVVHSRVPLGFLPAGTANVLAHELRVKGGMLAAAAAFHNLVPCRVAVGLLRTNDCDRYFLMMAGAGLDAQIVYDLNLDLKAALGKLAYYTGGFRQVFRPIPQFDVELHGRVRRCGFALVSRVRNYGGDLEIARGASLLRSDFEIVLFEGESSVGYLRYLAAVVRGRAHRMKGVTVQRATAISFRSPSDSRVYAQIDGELACHLPARVEIVPDALTMLVPAAYFERERALQQAAACV